MSFESELPVFLIEATIAFEAKLFDIVLIMSKGVVILLYALIIFPFGSVTLISFDIGSI